MRKLHSELHQPLRRFVKVIVNEASQDIFPQYWTFVLVEVVLMQQESAGQCLDVVGPGYNRDCIPSGRAPNGVH